MKITPKEYRAMHEARVTYMFDTSEDATRRARYMRDSGGFTNVTVFLATGGENAGRWLITADRVEGMIA